MRCNRGARSTLVAGVAAAVGLLLLSTAALAVPPVPQSLIKKEMWQKDTIKLDIRANVPERTRTGQWWCVVNVDVHYKTEWKGITLVTTYYTEYNWLDKWVVGRINKQMDTYLGVDPPTNADIKKAIEASSEADLFDAILGKQVTKVHEIRLAKDPKFSYSSPNEVTFAIEGEFDKMGYEEIKRVVQTGSGSLKRNNLKESWSSACSPSTPCLSGGFGAGGQYTEVSTRKMSSEALAKMDSIWKLALEKWVGPKYAALGAPDKFTNFVDFARFAYKALHTGDLKTWDAFLVRNGGQYAPDVYNQGNDWFIKPSKEFRRQYCPTLVLAERPDKQRLMNTVKFFDRGKVNKGYFVIQAGAAGYHLTKVAVDLSEGAKADEIAAIADDKGCVDNLPPPVNTNPKGFKPGDQIIGKQPHWSREFKGVVQAILEDEKAGKARVAFSDGAVEEVPMTSLRLAGEAAPPAAAGAAPAADPTFNLAIGDRVTAVRMGKAIPGTIISISGQRVQVKYDDGRWDWHPARNVTKP